MDEKALEQQLDAFDLAARGSALRQLAALPLPAPAASDNVNMHFHSFFSYNAEGWSPSHIAWRAHRAGLYAAGLCDFDVLDGLEEFLQAGELLGLRSTVNVETRAYVKELADKEISSPGEPGVAYVMGAGFVRMPAAGSPQAEGLARYREGATARNIALVDRINPHVPAVAVDYAGDVLPLTPTGSATERHIIRAYLNKSWDAFVTPEGVAGFWAGVLGKPTADLVPILRTPAMEEAMRSKLAKRGGFGYVQPSVDTFPPIDEFMAWVASCGAVPMATWLDGCSDGEADARALLECFVAQGAQALNIIPDRNWNFKDPQVQAEKVANLKAIVAAANDLGLPMNVGTEMNKAGLPFVDDLDGPVLSEFREDFRRGALIMVGHSILARCAGVSYATCDWETPRKNEFFALVGALPPLTSAVAANLAGMGPADAWTAINDAVKSGAWPA